MKSIRWAPDALADYENILDYCLSVDLAYAGLIEQRILSAVQLLSEHSIGRPTKVRDIRQKLVLKTPYRILYRENIEGITIVGLIHQKRDRQQL